MRKISMIKSMLPLFLFASVFGGLNAHANIPSDNPGRTWWGAVKVLSDPPGAHISNENGTYMGQTTEERPIYVYWWKDDTYSDYQPVDVSLTAEKRGYKTVTRTFPIRRVHNTSAAAAADPTVIMFVLQPMDGE